VNGLEKVYMIVEFRGWMHRKDGGLPNTTNCRSPRLCDPELEVEYCGVDRRKSESELTQQLKGYQDTIILTMVLKQSHCSSHRYKQNSLY
jgi:hypothetical protein